MRHNNLSYDAATHQGKRNGNQDNLHIGHCIPCADTDKPFVASGIIRSNDPQLVCVCDGVGGASNGDVAALIALETIDTVERCIVDDISLDELVFRAAGEAHLQVCNYFAKKKRLGGTTLALLGIQGQDFVMLNIGDSPVFMWHRNTQMLEELSCRHNRAWKKIREGIEPLPFDDNELLNYLGKHTATVEEMAHIVRGRVEDGDIFLLCSDGITNAWNLAELEMHLKVSPSAWALVETAAHQPFADNCTAVLLQMETGKEEYDEFGHATL